MQAVAVSVVVVAVTGMEMNVALVVEMTMVMKENHLALLVLMNLTAGEQTASLSQVREVLVEVVAVVLAAVALVIVKTVVEAAAVLRMMVHHVPTPVIGALAALLPLKNVVNVEIEILSEIVSLENHLKLTLKADGSTKPTVDPSHSKNGRGEEVSKTKIEVLVDGTLVGVAVAVLLIALHQEMAVLIDGGNQMHLVPMKDQKNAPSCK